MEQENRPSVRELEKDLGAKVTNLRVLLSNHKTNLGKIESGYNGEKFRLTRMREQAHANADIERQSAESAARTQYDSGVKSVNHSYQSRVDEEQSQYNSKKNKQLSDNQSLAVRNQNRIGELTALENAWRIYIDKVHSDFDKEVDKAKQDYTDRIKWQYESLAKSMNQSALGEKGKVSYDRVSPFFYALCHPFQELPVFLNGIRVFALALAIIWIAIMICVAMANAFEDNDVQVFMASALVRYGLYATLGYLFFEFLCGYISTFAWVVDQNKFKKWQRENENDSILRRKAAAEDDMLNFNKKYKHIYFVNGRWDFDWRRYPMTKSEADVILNDVRKANQSMMPRLYEGILPYAFEINYNALNIQY